MTPRQVEAVKLLATFRRPGDRGLGDTVARIARITGTAFIVKTAVALLGMDCGCEERREALNRDFPYAA